MIYDPNSYVKDVVAAKIMDCGVQSLRNWRFMQTGPPYCKCGRMVRYRVKDLIDFMEAGRIAPQTQQCSGKEAAVKNQSCDQAE